MKITPENTIYLSGGEMNIWYHEHNDEPVHCTDAPHEWGYFKWSKSGSPQTIESSSGDVSYAWFFEGQLMHFDQWCEATNAPDELIVAIKMQHKLNTKDTSGYLY